MRNSFLLVLLAVLARGELCLGQAPASRPAHSPVATAPAVANEDLIVTGLGNLKKLYDLKSIIRDVPGGALAGIRFDQQHRLYVATYGYGSFEAWTVGKKPIYRIEADGRVAVFAEIVCGMLGILGIDEANSVYVTTTNDRNAEFGTDILKITENGTVASYSTGYKQPCSGVFDRAGNFYFVDALQKKVFKIAPQGARSVFLDINSSSLASGLLFHGMAFDSSFSTCYLVGYSAGMGKVLKCGIDETMRPGPLEMICDLFSPKYVWVDAKNNAFVNYGDNRIAGIFADGARRLYSHALFSSMLDDFDRKLYIVSPECGLYQIMEDEAPPDEENGQSTNAAPRIIEFSLGRDSLACGHCSCCARIEDEASCGVQLFLLHAGRCDSLRLERDSRDSSLYRLTFDGYTRGDSLAAWLVAVDERGLPAASDTLDFCFRPYLAGDLDDDGGADIFDLLALLRMLSGSTQPTAGQRCSGDLDRDGMLGIFDLLALLKQLAS